MVIFFISGAADPPDARFVTDATHEAYVAVYSIIPLADAISGGVLAHYQGFAQQAPHEPIPFLFRQLLDTHPQAVNCCATRSQVQYLLPWSAAYHVDHHFEQIIPELVILCNLDGCQAHSLLVTGLGVGYHTSGRNAAC